MRHGRAAFKTRLAEHCIPDASCLPYRQDLVDLLRREKARGRAIHLVTAAAQAIADAVAAHLDLFTSATGSDRHRNLKGAEKLAFLQRQFPDGFVYVGDHSSDVPVFSASRGIILCDLTERVAREIAVDTPVFARLTRPARDLRLWLRAMRVHQWSKNVLVFVPLVLGHAYERPANILASIVGFLLVCLLASATYMINDIADLERDRLHLLKRFRPFASGRLPVSWGLLAPPLMIAVAILGAVALAPAFGITLTIYLCLTIAYSFGLKQVPLLDVFIIGILFVLRIVMGAEVVGLQHSPWLLSFSWTFFLSLALAKRHVEVMRAATMDVKDVVGRGYHGQDWPLTLSFGVGTGLISVVIMLLYLANDAVPSGLYTQSKWLYAMPAIVTMWLMRIWLLSHRIELHDDPVVFALRDKVSLGLAVAAAVLFALAI